MARKEVALVGVVTWVSGDSSKATIVSQGQFLLCRLLSSCTTPSVGDTVIAELIPGSTEWYVVGTL